MNKESAYWIALAHIPTWGYSKINNLIINFFHEHKLSIEEFFSLSEQQWKDELGLSTDDILDLARVKNEIPGFAFLAELLDNEGYEMIPITSPLYSKTLKGNLKTAKSPAVLYVKGNIKLLQETSVAIVGSRNAGKISLDFTDNIAKKTVTEGKIVVSGFAKGVDKQALDSALSFNGKSIIVLPQGILTFASGFKNYYKEIVNGDVLVLSTFFPKSPWKTELAMARNPIIYGLAEEIFVAESGDKGGTWAGVIDGLRKKRKIFVRKPENVEKNANNLLIEKGALPVDLLGNLIEQYQTAIEDAANNAETRILNILQDGEFEVKEIKRRIGLSLTENEIRSIIKSNKEIVSIKAKPIRYALKSRTETLFD